VLSSIEVISGPGDGSTNVDGISGVITYTPALGFYGTDSFDYEVCDDGTPLPSLCATATVTIVVTVAMPSSHFIYLPLMPQAFDHSLADLIVTDLVASGDAITVVVKNSGSSVVTSPFWVHVYIDPLEPPSVNKIWQQIGAHGAAWNVTDPVPADGELTLTVGEEYYVPEESDHGNLLPGIPVWAQVDVFNLSTTYGNVMESVEGNNVFGPVLSTAGAHGRVAPSSDQVRSTGVAEELPLRE
jgi:hypothetical protein